jgi:hypothetical protein
MIKIGDTLPEATLTEFIAEETAGCTLGPNAFKVSDMVKGKKIVVFKKKKRKGWRMLRKMMKTYKKKIFCCVSLLLCKLWKLLFF